MSYIEDHLANDLKDCDSYRSEVRERAVRRVTNEFQSLLNRVETAENRVEQQSGLLNELATLRIQAEASDQRDEVYREQITKLSRELATANLALDEFHDQAISIALTKVVNDE